MFTGIKISKKNKNYISSYLNCKILINEEI